MITVVLTEESYVHVPGRGRVGPLKDLGRNQLVELLGDVLNKAASIEHKHDALKRELDVLRKYGCID